MEISKPNQLAAMVALVPAFVLEGFVSPPPLLVDVAPVDVATIFVDAVAFSVMVVAVPPTLFGPWNVAVGVALGFWLITYAVKRF